MQPVCSNYVLGLRGLRFVRELSRRLRLSWRSGVLRCSVRGRQLFNGRCSRAVHTYVFGLCEFLILMCFRVWCRSVSCWSVQRSWLKQLFRHALHVCDHHLDLDVGRLSARLVFERQFDRVQHLSWWLCVLWQQRLQRCAFLSLCCLCICFSDSMPRDDLRQPGLHQLHAVLRLRVQRAWRCCMPLQSGLNCCLLVQILSYVMLIGCAGLDRTSERVHPVSSRHLQERAWRWSVLPVILSSSWNVRSLHGLSAQFDIAAAQSFDLVLRV